MFGKLMNPRHVYLHMHNIEHFKNGTLLMVYANTVLCICGSKMRDEVAMPLNK